MAFIKNYLYDAAGNGVTRGAKFIAGPNGAALQTIVIDGKCFYREYVQSQVAAACTHGTYTYETATDGTGKDFPAPDGTTVNYKYLTNEANDKLGHNYTVDKGISVQPTCTKTGTRIYGCTRCSSTTTRTEAATGHNYVRRSESYVTGTVTKRSGRTGWHDKYGTTAAPYCDHCGASWGSDGHCTWTENTYGTRYYNQCTKCGDRVNLY